MNILEGVRVIDLTQAQAGPMCTMFLADMGAEVIKIEPPWGEMTRFFPPLVEEKVSPYFVFLNRNKKGITLNLTSEKGAAIFKEFVKISDVVVENYSPETMENVFGLGYDTLQEINPKIVFASISGYGQYGPYAKRLSHAETAEAASGYLDLMRDKIDPSGPPLQPPQAIGDTVPGIFCAMGILSALFHRERTGQGQRIDLAQVDCMVGVSTSITFRTLLKEKTTWNRALEEGFVVPPLYKAKDGYIMMVPGLRYVERLAKAMGVEPQSIDKQLVDEWVRDKTRAQVVNLLVEVRMPVAPVLTLDEVIDDPHILAREMIVEVNHPVLGKVKVPGFPIKFSATPVTIETPDPLLGQHNEEVFCTLLGYSKEEITKLHEDKVI